MSKKLRIEPIYIAPDIIGWLDKNGFPQVNDKRTGRELNPSNIDDKIYIYERQVKGWFLNPAKEINQSNSNDNGFIVLMICLSYLEGVEQYRRGKESNNRSKDFFVGAMNRLYPNKFQQSELVEFYSEARCGLFHDGMVKKRIIISNGFQDSLEIITGNDINVNITKFLEDIENDFNNYLHDLQTNIELRNRFNESYSNT